MLIVRTDRELQMPRTDAALRAEGHTLVLLPDGVSEDELCEAVAAADLILMCYTPITARVIAAAPRLKGIVKYGVGGWVTTFRGRRWDWSGSARSG